MEMDTNTTMCGVRIHFSVTYSPFFSSDQGFDDFLILFFADDILLSVDDKTYDNQCQRKKHHGGFHDEKTPLGEKFSLPKRIDSRDDQGVAHDSVGHGSAHLVDERLNGEGDTFISLPQLQMPVFNGIRQENQHEQLDEGLSHKKQNACSPDEDHVGWRKEEDEIADDNENDG